MLNLDALCGDGGSRTLGPLTGRLVSSEVP